MSSTISGAGYEFGVVFLVVGVVGLYMLPTVVAVLRHSPRTLLVAVLNLLTGWTVAGWLWSLALAAW